MAVAASPPDPVVDRSQPDVLPGRDTARWLLAGIVLLGVLVRFTTLGEQSFWYDEATTRGIVAHGLGHVLATVPKTESTPFLYYVLVWLWSRVFGLGEAGLRSFSALCSTLTIPVVWMIGRRLVSERVGLIAALLTAVNPFLFWYAQEARSYSLLLLLSALSLLFLVRALELPNRSRLLAWGLVSAVALGVHYFAAVAIVPEGVWLAFALHRRGELTLDRIAVGLGPILAVGAALIPLIIAQNDGRAGYIGNASGSLPFRVAQLVKQDIIGDGQPVEALLTVVGCSVVLLAVVLLLRRGRRSERSAAILPLAIGAGGVLLALLVSAVVTDYFNTRNLIPTWPALALVVAAGLGASRAGWVGTAATATLVALGLFCVWNVISNPAFQRENWRGAAHALGPLEAPRAIVADLGSEVPLQPYLRGLHSYPSNGSPVSEVDVMWLARDGSWGPIAPLTPAVLPGFSNVKLIRTSSYVVVRYRASQPVLEPVAALIHLYPVESRALALQQR